MSYQLSEPDIVETLSDLNAGVAREIATRCMADVAMAVAGSDQARAKGEVVLKLQFVQAKGEGILGLKYRIDYKHPTARGAKAEHVEDEMLVYVNKKGAVTFTPDAQGKLMFEEVE